MTGSLKAIQEEGEGIISTDLVINKERVRVISRFFLENKGEKIWKKRWKDV